MSKVWYGNLTNRLEEGRNLSGSEIKVGDDVTMYHYSDRTCYYVTFVENQKRIKVRRYYVCADKSKPGGMGHQDWVYFKTLKERDEYCNLLPLRTDEEYAQIDREETWVFRYGKWQREYRLEELLHPDAYSKREVEHFNKHGWVNTYGDLSGKVSFGRRDYYYDWEF